MEYLNSTSRSGGSCLRRILRLEVMSVFANHVGNLELSSLGTHMFSSLELVTQLLVPNFQTSIWSELDDCVREYMRILDTQAFCLLLKGFPWTSFGCVIVSIACIQGVHTWAMNSTKFLRKKWNLVTHAPLIDIPLNTNYLCCTQYNPADRCGGRPVWILLAACMTNQPTVQNKSWQVENFDELCIYKVVQKQDM